MNDINMNINNEGDMTAGHQKLNPNDSCEKPLGPTSCSKKPVTCLDCVHVKSTAGKGESPSGSWHNNKSLTFTKPAEVPAVYDTTRSFRQLTNPADSERTAAQTAGEDDQ